jgi:hypothetical protein
LANKEIKLNINDLDKEYQMFLNEFKSLEELYDEAKDLLDKSSRIATRSNPVFMASQTSNLVSIKEKRIGIIKELAGIKKSKLELQMKEFNLNKKDNEMDGSFSKETLDMFKLLTGIDRSELLSKTNEIEINDEESFELDDEEFDAAFETAVNDNKRENFKENTKKKKINIPDYLTIVVDAEKNKYLIDDDYNIIEDEKYQDVIDSIIITDFESENDEDFAIDNDGNRYEVIELE